MTWFIFRPGLESLSEKFGEYDPEFWQARFSSPERSSSRSHEGVSAALTAGWEAQLGLEGYFQDPGCVVPWERLSARWRSAPFRVNLRWADSGPQQSCQSAGGWCWARGVGAAGSGPQNRLACSVEYVSWARKLFHVALPCGRRLVSQPRRVCL